jgi:thioredoxin-dependent peroxiredoxin
MLSIGSKAPDFKLRLDTGDIFRLSDLAGKNTVVLSFIPDDFAKNESKDAYIFLQQLQKAQSLGAVVIAISPQNMAGLRDLLTLYSFSLPIASDPTLEVCRNYRAQWLRGLALRNIAYVIDTRGIIRGRVSHQLLSEKPWSQILRLLKDLNKDDKSERMESGGT